VKIAIGADHAGFLLKKYLLEHLPKLSYLLLDCGSFNSDPCDYPDVAKSVAQALKDQQCTRGIVICGSGVGVAIAANKIKGIRASVCHDSYSARLAVEHNNMNILALGARVIGEGLACELALSFLKAEFSNESRHKKRLNKIIAIEDLKF
jgi:ribose 5-phosphate isomerase B